MLNDSFDDFAISLGFERSKADYCLYYKICGMLKMFILLYVDDIICTGNNLEYPEILKNEFSKRFEKENSGELKFFLSIGISRDMKDKTVSFGRKLFIKNLNLKRFVMVCCKTVSTPIEVNLKLNKSNEMNKELVGCLMFLTLSSRL